MKQYCENDFYLEYPDDWEVRSDSDNGCDGVTVEAPEGGFLTISRFPSLYEPEELVHAVVEEITSEYENCDVEHTHEEYTMGTLCGVDVDFLYLDLPCTVSVHSLRAAEATYVFFRQTAELQEDRTAQFHAVVERFLEFLEPEEPEKQENP